MHIQEPDQKEWIQEQVEGAARRRVTATEQAPHPRAAERGRGVRALPAHEVPRAEALQPRRRGDARSRCSTFLLDAAADAGMDEVVMGMAHRGRLNVLANVVGKSYAQIFREFEGELDPNVHAGLGRREVPPRRDRQAPVAGRARRSRSRSPPTRATSRRSTRSSRAWRAPSRTAAATTSTTQRAAGAHPRRRRVRGPGRGRRDAQPLGAARLRRRRHRAHRRQQPARVHHRARASGARACTPPTSPRWCRRRSST